MKKDVQFLDAKNVCFGAKIVRGAYLEAEKGAQQEAGDGEAWWFVWCKAFKKKCLFGITWPTLVTLPTLDIFINLSTKNKTKNKLIKFKKNNGLYK